MIESTSYSLATVASSAAIRDSASAASCPASMTPRSRASRSAALTARPGLDAVDRLKGELPVVKLPVKLGKNLPDPGQPPGRVRLTGDGGEHQAQLAASLGELGHQA